MCHIGEAANKHGDFVVDAVDGSSIGIAMFQCAVLQMTVVGTFLPVADLPMNGCCQV